MTLISNVTFIVLDWGQKISACEALNVESAATITLPDIVHELNAPLPTAAGIVEWLKRQGHLRVSVPKHAPVCASLGTAFRPRIRIEVLHTI